MRLAAPCLLGGGADEVGMTSCEGGGGRGGGGRGGGRDRGGRVVW